MTLHYPVQIKIQPTESSCGPTCLQSLYAFHNDFHPLEQIVKEIPELKTGGVLGVQLGLHALSRGYQARIYTHNLKVFDPTWFKLSREQMLEKLEKQIQSSKASKVIEASLLYAEFLSQGGQVLFETLDPEFIRRLLSANGPIATGLSATYLYRSPREYGPHCEYDDIHGEPQGHFVVITGVSDDLKQAWIADPHEANPVAEGQHYAVSTQELINAILIGVITYDANLIVIQPKTTEPT